MRRRDATNDTSVRACRRGTSGLGTSRRTSCVVRSGHDFRTSHNAPDRHLCVHTEAAA
jgi:hypothetical protein